MDKIWYRNPSKSEVIGRCGGDEKPEGPRRTDRSRTLKRLDKYQYLGLMRSGTSHTCVRVSIQMVPVHGNHFVRLSNSSVTCAILSHRGCIGTHATVLVPDVQPSAVVKTGALITSVITSSTCCLNQELQARPYI